MTTPETTSSAAAVATEPFGSMHDLRCPVTVLLGTASITLRRCLELAPDSVVRLDQVAGEDLELFVNGVLLARGEVVIIEDATSLRVTTVDVSADTGP